MTLKSSHELPQLPRHLKIWLAITSLAFICFVGICIYAWLQSEDLPVPRSETARLSKTNPYLFDVVLVDGAVLEKSEIADMVRPLRMVLQRRLPGQPYHARIAVYGAGLPLSINAERAVAGFLQSEDSFFVDLRTLRSHKPLPGTRAQWWGVFMGHEAMHFIQKARGDRMLGGSRGDAYDTDPEELEAAREGASVANSLGIQVSWAFAGTPLKSEHPVVYWPYALASTPDAIRVSTATTRRGTIVRSWARLKALLFR